MNQTGMIISRRITVRGLVQGVGFRPFVYRMATERDLKGWILNRTDSVLIHIEGPPGVIQSFMDDVISRSPVLARIDSIVIDEASFESCDSFVIRPSEDNSNILGDISPDMAVCDECLEDMEKQPNRIRYPFVNCTNCGPRFSIIRDLPYDRANTTMSDFPMCDSCAAEYHDIQDRRFHAQPVACAACGPSMQLFYDGVWISDTDVIPEIASSLVREGKIIAIKGMGGFQLICDATSDIAVNELRVRKQRDGKPFAVMMRDLHTVREYAKMTDEEEVLLKSHVRPVVILDARKYLADGVSRGLSTIGCILPYMPIHYLLFRYLSTPAIVFTSGNLSGEPIVIDNRSAVNLLEGIADAFIFYNRDIHNRTDDSVTRFIGNTGRVIRRSRGYVPAPVKLLHDCSGILACGAGQKVTFALGNGGKGIVSQHIGDLDNVETMDFYTETIERYKNFFRTEPEYVAADLHPDYLSTRYAERTGLPLVRVQHHHAHVCACMAEFGIDRNVLGVSIDGTGYGDDGAAWGCEFMICSLEGYERITHLDYIPLPGGEKAIHEPWRMAVSCLYHCLGIDPREGVVDPLKKIDTSAIEHVILSIDNKINTAMTSSMGRIFDAVACMLGLCSKNTFDAEGPIRLEGIADTAIHSRYGYEFKGTIKLGTMFDELLTDIKSGIDSSVISGKFHNTIVDIIATTSEKICRDTGIDTIVLSGGIFQNRILLNGVLDRLSGSHMTVFSPEIFPVNDGGISLGQLASAAKRRHLGCV